MFYLIIFILLIILLGILYSFKSNYEKKKFKELNQKESELKDIVIITKNDVRFSGAEGNRLLTSNMVISIDFFRNIIAIFIEIFGGRLSLYESFLDKARRGTIVKLKQIAKDNGFNALINIKLETSIISGLTDRQIGSIEILAYATAVNLPNDI